MIKLKIRFSKPRDYTHKLWNIDIGTPLHLDSVVDALGLVKYKSHVLLIAKKRPKTVRGWISFRFYKQYSNDFYRSLATGQHRYIAMCYPLAKRALNLDYAPSEKAFTLWVKAK